MSRFRLLQRVCSCIAVFAAALALCTAQAHAAPDQIDPAAMRLLNQTAATYGHLTTFSCRLLQNQGNGEPNSDLPRILSGTVYLRRPNKIALYITDLHDNARQQVVSDSSGYYWRITDDPKHYVKDTPSDADAKLAFLDCNASGLYLHNLLNYSRDFWHYQFDAPAPHPMSVKIGAPGLIDGIPVVTVSLDADTGQDLETTTYAIGKADHLVRQVTFVKRARFGDAYLSSYVETYVDVHANQPLPESAFVFVPRAGTKPATRGQLAAYAAANAPPEYDATLKPGADPIPIDATDLDGKPVTLAQYAGKVVMLDFWATWCGPCRGELPNVVATYRKYHDQGFEIVGISLDEDENGLGAFLKKNGISWRQVCDGLGWKNAVAQAYKVNAIPFSLVIGKDGKIAAVDARGPALEQAVAAALKK